MRISDHILTEAKKLLTEGMMLPAQITSAPHFYVAEPTDQKIHAFTVVKHGDKNYKIGTLKQG